MAQALRHTCIWLSFPIGLLLGSGLGLAFPVIKWMKHRQYYGPDRVRYIRIGRAIASMSLPIAFAYSLSYPLLLQWAFGAPRFFSNMGGYDACKWLYVLGAGLGLILAIWRHRNDQITPPYKDSSR
jgi:hypothetical protein